MAINRFRLLAAVFGCSFLGICSIHAQTLRIYHIDVEQGASTLIVSPGGKTLLVDAGKNGHGARVKAVLKQAGVERINHFVATHFHEDHYGGADELAPFVVEKAYDRGDKDELSDQDRNEDAFLKYQASVGGTAEQLTRGEIIPLDPLVTVTCVASGGIVLGEDNPVPGEDENDKSIALQIEFGDFRFFVGGDIELTTEGKIAARDLVLDVDLYQANHHGSHTSSSQSFMDDLSPTVVIVSNGNNGVYKHPRRHTLDLLRALTPRPVVFQTNKYLKGGLGGNVEDAYIADLESTRLDGTILVTVEQPRHKFTVSYRDAMHEFAIKARGMALISPVVIESLLPDPDLPDRDAEEVTLRNKTGAAISMTGWILKDRDNLAWSLESLGMIGASESKTIRRNGMPMSLNNNGDTIRLFGPGNQKQDEFEYSSVSAGQRISTGH